MIVYATEQGISGIGASSDGEADHRQTQRRDVDRAL